MKKIWTILYVAFVLGLGFACYHTPIPGDFDRYMCEGVIRTSRHEDPRQVYDSIRRESPRMEQSSHSGLFDSPDHFVKLEPLYRVKPLYLWVVRAVSGSWLPIQTSISIVSAVSLCALGLIFLLWTRSPFLSGLLLASPAAIQLGRDGTPDGLAAVFVVAGLWAVKRNHTTIGLLILVSAVWLRTDNVLVLVCVCIWVWWMKRVPAKVILLFGTAGILSVFLVNRLADAYSWNVLFRASFIGGHPGEIADATITLHEYLRVFLSNGPVLALEIAIYALLAAVAWRLSRKERALILTVAAASALHFILFPSPERRYLLWGCLAVGIALILSLQDSVSRSTLHRGSSDAESATAAVAAVARE
jgi:hypothetical protein